MMTNRIRDAIDRISRLTGPTVGQKSEVVRLMQQNEYRRLIWLLDRETKVCHPDGDARRQWQMLKDAVPTWMREESLAYAKELV